MQTLWPISYLCFLSRVSEDFVFNQTFGTNMGEVETRVGRRVEAEEFHGVTHVTFASGLLFFSGLGADKWLNASKLGIKTNKMWIQHNSFNSKIKKGIYIYTYCKWLLDKDYFRIFCPVTSEEISYIQTKERFTPLPQHTHKEKKLFFFFFPHCTDFSCIVLCSGL